MTIKHASAFCMTCTQTKVYVISLFEFARSDVIAGITFITTMQSEKLLSWKLCVNAKHTFLPTAVL